MKKQILILLLTLLMALTACGQAQADYAYTLIDHGAELDAEFSKRNRWIPAEGGTLEYLLMDVEGIDRPLFSNLDSARIQRWHDGQWMDIGMTVPLTGTHGEVQLSLRDGYYRLAIPIEGKRFIGYDFAVGSLSNLSARDLPAGRETIEAVDVSFEPLYEPYHPDSQVIYYQETYGADTNYCAWEHFVEVKLDDQWCQLPVRFDYSRVLQLAAMDYDVFRNDTFQQQYWYITDPQEPEYYFFPLSSGEYRIVGSSKNYIWYNKAPSYIALPSFTVIDGETPSITDELTQRYELTDLRWQEGLFRAIANSNVQFTTAGLHAGTGRLIVVYETNHGEEFWLECHRLSSTEQVVALEQSIPQNIWLTNPETPEHRAELLLQAEDRQLYAIYLRSERMTEEEILRAAKTVHVWLPGEEKPIDISCTDDNAKHLQSRIPWTQSGDPFPNTDDGTLTLRVDTRENDLVSNRTWRLQRLTNGRWYDMDQQGEGLESDGSAVWGSVELSLPAGEYRLMLHAVSKHGEFTEIPYYFQSIG